VIGAKPQVGHDRIAAASALAWLDRWIIPLLCLCLIWIATQVTVANLPADKVFVGHDSGFYFLFPHEFARLSSQAWQVKSDFGSPNYEALVTQGLMIPESVVAALHMSQPLIGRAFYEFQLLLLEFGMFWSLWLTVNRAFPGAPKVIRALAAWFGTLVATFNIFTALLLLYPSSNFQLGIMIWPLVIAAEQYVLWIRPRVSAALLFGLLLTIATWGNPATTIVGLMLVGALYAAHCVSSKNWQLKVVLAAGGVFLVTTMFFWLPTLVEILLYPGAGLSNVAGTDQGTLAVDEAINAQRETLGALLRFDGLIWWPKTRDADIFASWPMIVTTSIPAVVAVAAAFSRSVYGLATWVLLLIGLELTKGLHGPFAIDMGWIATYVPMAAAFRETYSKFILIVLIALPMAFAIGSVHLWAQSTVRRAAVCVGFLAVAFNMWPFLAGRVAEPYFLSTIPPDYAVVDRLTGSDPDNRILSLPGAPGSISVTSWFKGGNFEDFLYHAKTVDAATFKARSISAATLYDDFSMQQARELPELMGLVGIYHINYVLLHKDYLTSYRMAFDYERYKVLGRLLARASEPFLDADPRLQKIFEGPNLVLYRVRSSATLPYAYGTYSAGLQNGYENTLFGSVESGFMNPALHPDLLFAGNQYEAKTKAQSYRLAALVPKTAFLVESPLIPEVPSLYPNQISLPTQYVSALSKRYAQLDKPKAYVFVQPHGDYITGTIDPIENIAGAFTVTAPSVFTPRVTVEARRVPREITADFVGTEGQKAWPISSFFNQPIPDEELLDDTFANAPVAQSVYAVPIHISGNTIERNIVSSALTQAASVAYQFRLTTDSTYDEVIVASGPKVAASLLDDPRVTFLYEMPTPDVEAAWLRFVLRGPGGRLVHFDKQLDATGHLDDYGLRDAVQAALDRRFDHDYALHSNDRAWITSRKFYNPQQADDYYLTGVSLVVGKKPGFDASTQTSVFSFKMRGMTIDLAGGDQPAYPARGFYSTFASTRAMPVLGNLQSSSVTRTNGALLVNATIQKQPLILNQSLVGHSADFRLKNGGELVGTVLSELPDAYVVGIQSGQQEQLYKSSVDAVSAITQGPGLYSLTMNLPALDLAKYPELHVRYLQGSNDEDVRLRLGMDTPHGFVEITPNYDINANAIDQEVPEDWIKPASPLGTNTVLALDNNPVFEPSGWREIACDMRKVETLLGTLDVRLRYVKLNFVLNPTMSNGETNAETAPITAFSFGFGDVAFFGQVPVGSLRGPGGNAFSLDSHSLRLVSQDRIAGAPDLLNLSFANVRLAPGVHRFDTFFRQPWLLRSAVFVPQNLKQHPSNPDVRIKRIDDLLYAVHVNANKPTWLAFAETYNPGWRLIPASAPRGRLPWLLSMQWLHAPVSDHVVGNAYNNTWYIRAPSSGDYVIDFAPQDFTILGRTIALCALFLAIGLSTLWWRKAW